MIRDIIQDGAIIAFAIYYLINLLIKKYGKNNSLKQSNILASKIYPILWKALNTFRASRIYIIEFHNGEKTYSSQHIQKMTAMYEVNIEHVEKVSSKLKDIIVDENTHTIISLLRTNEAFELRDNNHPLYERFVVDMTIYNYKSFIVVPLRNRVGNISGIMYFHFMTENWLNEFDKAKIQLIKNELQNLINN
jgi:hypothetical protein